MSIHAEPHPLAGRTVKLSPVRVTELVREGDQFELEDWCDRVYGKSWLDAYGTPAPLLYAERIAGHAPIDDRVLYGKIGGVGVLVHESEIVAE